MNHKDRNTEAIGKYHAKIRDTKITIRANKNKTDAEFITLLGSVPNSSIIIWVRTESKDVFYCLYFSLDNISMLDNDDNYGVQSSEQRCCICHKEETNLHHAMKEVYFHPNCWESLVRLIKKFLEQNASELASESI